MFNAVIIDCCRGFAPETASKIILAVEILLVCISLAALLWLVFAGKFGKKKSRWCMLPLLLVLLLNVLFLLPRPINEQTYSTSTLNIAALNNAILIAVTVLSAIILLLGIVFVFCANRMKHWKCLVRSLLAAAVLLLAMAFLWLLPYANDKTEYEVELVGTYETSREETFPFVQPYYQFGSGILRVKSDLLPGEQHGWTTREEEAWLGAQTYDFENYTYIVTCGQRIDTVTVDPWHSENVLPYPFTELRMRWSCSPERIYDSEELEQTIFLYRMKRVALE